MLWGVLIHMRLNPKYVSTYQIILRFALFIVKAVGGGKVGVKRGKSEKQ